MRLFLILLTIVYLNSCTTVEVTKEIIKAGSSVKNTVTGIVNEKKDESELIIEEKQDTEKENIEKEKEEINQEQSKRKKIVEKQQKASQLNFIGNSLSKIKKILGEPQLEREDGNVYVLRYNSKECRIFLFFNNNAVNKKVEYFEVRDKKGNLLDSKQSIENCYKELKLI